MTFDGDDGDYSDDGNDDGNWDDDDSQKKNILAELTFLQHNVDLWQWIANQDWKHDASITGDVAERVITMAYNWAVQELKWSPDQAVKYQEQIRKAIARRCKIVARKSDPSTSKEAAEKVNPSLIKVAGLVALGAIFAANGPSKGTVLHEDAKVVAKAFDVDPLTLKQTGGFTTTEVWTLIQASKTTPDHPTDRSAIYYQQRLEAGIKWLQDGGILFDSYFQRENPRKQLPDGTYLSAQVWAVVHSAKKPPVELPVPPICDGCDQVNDGAVFPLSVRGRHTGGECVAVLKRKCKAYEFQLKALQRKKYPNRIYAR